MGQRNPDRIPIAMRRSRHETVAQMEASGWDVQTKCLSCGLHMRADLKLIARVRGPETSLWNRRQRCKRIGCLGFVQFLAKAPGMAWHEPLEARDADADGPG